MNIVYRQPRNYYGNDMCSFCRKPLSQRDSRTIPVGFYWQPGRVHDACHAEFHAQRTDKGAR